MLGVVYALCASCAWGTSDFIGGLKTRKLTVLTVMLPSQGLALALISAIVVARGAAPPRGEFVFYGVLAGVAATAGLAAFYRGMAVGDISIVAPITSTAAVIPVAYGLATGDDLTAAQLAGIVLAMTGIVLASREVAKTAERRRTTVAGAGFAVLAAVFIGSFFVTMDAAGGDDVFWASLVHRATSVVLLLAAAAVVRPALRIPRADAWAIAAIGALEITANVTFTLASTEDYVSVVSVLASLYAVVTVVLARAVLKERIAGVQRAGALLALAGVGFLGAG